MTRAEMELIPLNLPIYSQCLRLPAEWRYAQAPGSYNAARDRWLGLSRKISQEYLEVGLTGLTATIFDPWEKRAEFFRLRQGDADALLAFLNTVGVLGVLGVLGSLSHEENVLSTPILDSDGRLYRADYKQQERQSEIWGIRRLILGSVRNPSWGIGKSHDFRSRVVRVDGSARVVITTTTFIEALALTLVLDRVRNARIRKCLRPDCATTFTVTTRHKRKYCCWNCGHIESVRRQRRKAKKPLLAYRRYSEHL